MQTHLQLLDRGRAFASRTLGGELREEVEELGASSNVVQVDFEGVLSVSYSFADAFVGELAQRLAGGELSFAVRLSGASPDVRRVLGRCLQNRQLAPTLLGDGLEALAGT